MTDPNAPLPIEHPAECERIAALGAILDERLAAAMLDTPEVGDSMEAMVAGLFLGECTRNPESVYRLLTAVEANLGPVLAYVRGTGDVRPILDVLGLPGAS